MRFVGTGEAELRPRPNNNLTAAFGPVDQALRELGVNCFPMRGRIQENLGNNNALSYQTCATSKRIHN